MFNRGFSLVELTIAVSIFAFLSVATVSIYANFDNRTGVDLLAHQMAQFGHEAQVSALSVKKSTASSTYPGYGLHFERASSTNFIFFADLDGNGVYTNSGGACGTPLNECERNVALLQGITITSLCGETTSPTPTQGDCSAGLKSADKFDIMFKRPSPDAQLKGVSGATTNIIFSSAQVNIRSKKNYGRSINFYNTGQITVKGDVQ